jgi:hypothetical protein
MTNPQDEALRGEEWDEYKDLTVRDVILIWIGERKSNLDTTILENGMSFLLSSRLAEARADERRRVREMVERKYLEAGLFDESEVHESVKDEDSFFTGAGVALTKLRDSICASLEITNQYEEK